jgi:hypothetical protein
VNVGREQEQAGEQHGVLYGCGAALGQQRDEERAGATGK